MPVAMRSDLQSEFELEYTRQVHLCRGLAEIRIGNLCVDTSETNGVKQVECIGPEDKSQILANLKIPGNAQVLINEMRITKTVGACRRRVAVGERRRRDKG